MATLLEEYLDATSEFQEVTGASGALFDRSLDEDELLAVAELSTIGADSE